MYYRHFGLHGPPFPLTPDTGCFYPGAGRGEILAAMLHALHAGCGILKLTGEVGSGKTMLARMLMERLAPEAELVYLANPSLERRDVHQAIALELGIEPEPGLSRVRLLDRIQQRLIEIHRGGRRTVVFIEEAQGMPPESLEEVRYLSNLETTRERLLQIVLIGQPELDRLLARRELRPLDDRIAHGFRLPPLTAAEVEDYLRFRLRRAGHASGELFVPAASRRLHRASGGRLRRVHVLAEKALLAAYAAGASRVLPVHVRRACRERDAETGRRWHRVRLWTASLGAGAAAGLLLFGLLSPTISIGKAGGSLPPTARSRMSLPSNATTAPARRAEQGRAAAARPRADDWIAQRMQALSELAMPGKHRYAIQLTTTYDRNPRALARHLAPLPTGLRSRLFIYPVVIGGRERYSVVLGPYDSLAEARRALASLPAALMRDHPYIRPLPAIRLEAGLGLARAPS